MLDPTPLFRAYAKWATYRQDKRSDVDIQKHVLLSLVRHAANTRFGREHRFSDITAVADFQRQVPLRSYDVFWQEYWSKAFPVLTNCTWPGTVPFFAMSSGTTTGKSKYIPYTPDMRRAASRGMSELLVRHVMMRPASRLLGGDAVMLSGPLDLETIAPGIKAGAVSAIAALGSPRLLHHRLLPPAEIAAIDDWQEKIRRLAPLSLARDVRALGGSPNWLLLFLEEVARQCRSRPERLCTWYPNLELIVHGGVNFAPYRERFRELMEGTSAETREVYSASEGFFGIADREDGEGLRLLPKANVFFEFVPVEEIGATSPKRHWIANIEPGVNYSVVVTTAAGLWSYVLGDTVRILTRDPPRFLVTGRISHVLSTFGEHLILEEIEKAVSTAARSVGVHVIDYCVAAKPASREQAGGWHDYVIETDPASVDRQLAARFADVLDRTLCDLNEDYRELRHGDFNLRPPHIRFALRGGLVAWMKLRRGLGGQHKLPRIINDPVLFSDLEDFVKNYRPPEIDR